MKPRRAQADRCWRFEMQNGSDGLRIYALSGARIIAGLDAGYHGNYLAISVIYVLPSWRKAGIAEALREQFFVVLESFSGPQS